MELKIVDKGVASDEIAALLGDYTAEQYSRMRKKAHFMFALDGETLIGVTWGHGDGVTWFVPRIFVDETYRGRGVGMKLRKALLRRLEENTTGVGEVFGYYTDARFWDKLPGTENIAVEGKRGKLGRRMITGTS